MRILFIALQRETEAARHADGPPPGTDPARLARLEAEQALAMARSLRDGGRLAPLLVCRRGSRLHGEAVALGLPVLAVSGGGDVAAHARLWLWQRRHKALLIQTVGAEAVGFGHRVLRMRKNGSALLSHAFFVRPPAPECCRSRAMRAAARVFCGSEHVRRRIREIWEAMPEKRRPAAALDVLAPGIALADYRPEPAPPVAGAAHRFVFGMGESLAPRSGALLMARAMAALWQRDDLPPWEVRMFGSGPRFEEILREAADLGVASRLCILGDQPPADALRHCGAWVAPGTSPEELPQTLWAGVAAGLPVICAQSALHRERLAGAPAATALRVEENDPQALARAMIGVMRDERLRARMRQAEEQFRPAIGLEAMAERFRARCEELAADAAGGPHCPADGNAAVARPTP